MSEPAAAGLLPASATAPISRLRRLWPELAAALAWLVAAVSLNGMAVWHDVTWQLWIARQLNAGLGLYSAIMEVNPPLWFWMAQPIDLLAAATGWPAMRILIAAVFVLIGLSLALSAWLAATWSPMQRAMLLAGILAGTIIVPLADFAQREHLTLIAAIPYALLLARRAEGARVPLLLALAVGLLATPMFALKHYLLAIPVLLELWLVWRRGRAWRPIRAETVVLALGGLAYLAAILIFTPQYLTTMVPDLQLAYGDLRGPVVLILLNQMTMLGLICLFYFWHFRRELHPAAEAILLAAAGFALAYFIQFKGFGYQASPAVALLMLAVVLHVALRPALPRLRLSEKLTALLMVLTALLPALALGPFNNDFQRYSDRLLRDARPGMTAVMLTTKAARMWPMVEEKGLVWPSRYYHFWMMQSVANRLAEGRPVDGPLLDFVNRVRLETVEDFACNPPDILIGDGYSVDEWPFDMLAYFRQEPRFAELMKSYSAQFKLGDFSVYERKRDLQPPTGDCVTIAPAH